MIQCERCGDYENITDSECATQMDATGYILCAKCLRAVGTRLMRERGWYWEGYYDREGHYRERPSKISRRE